MKFTRALVLATLMAALAGGAMTAQDTKKAAPTTGQGKAADDKKDEKKVKGTVEYYEAADGWRWKVIIGGKAAITSPKGVEKKEDVLKEIEDVKSVLASTKPTEGKPTKKAAEKDKDKE
jgi:hypothetical protein